MKAYRVCLSLVSLILISSGCADFSKTPNINTQKPFSSVDSKSTLNTEIASRTVLPEPSIKPTGSSAIVNETEFNEDNIAQYLQFGTSFENVEKKLNDFKIPITDETTGDTPGWWDISTQEFTLNFDSENKLYSIWTSKLGTAKGLKIGDSLDTMHQLYGKESEYNELKKEYVYHYGDNLLSFYFGDDNTVNGWGLFTNIWNKPYEDGTTPDLGEGNSAVFNEENFMRNFPFGMSRAAVEKKLTELGVRITWVLFEDANDMDYWEIDTDHASFFVDGIIDRLNCIKVVGWDTAKGLKKGDTVKRLHQLYGKEHQYNKDFNGYKYKLKGYEFEVEFEGRNEQGADAVSSWWVYSNSQN